MPYVDSLVPTATQSLSASDVSVENILRLSSSRNGLKFAVLPISVYLSV